MLFLQLPASMPWVKQSATGETNEVDDRQKLAKQVGRLGKGCSLEELPAGFMGKLLVYQSGAVMWKIGDTLYNVSTLVITVPSLSCYILNQFLFGVHGKV